MRTIRFRGKDLNNEGQWRYGSLLQYPDGCAVIVEWDGQGTELSWDVDPASVGQSTGLQDKEGRDIYEGDIFDWHSHPYLVEFRGGEFFASSEACDPERYGGFSLKFIAYYDQRGKAKVIGNATDNPEMLKVGER